MSKFIGKILRIIGIIVCCTGFVSGLIVGFTFADDYSGSYGFFIGACIVLGSFISSVIIMGFGEIINLKSENVALLKDISYGIKNKNDI